MSVNLLDLPNEILEIIIFYVIDGPWKNDVRDFLSLTSSCQKLRQFVNDERYWQRLASRRDPTNTKPTDDTTWSNYCKQIYFMRTILPSDIQENVSRFNENYFCTIQKILLWPHKIRIFIDERGDYSLYEIQNPTNSTIGITTSGQYEQIAVSGSEFSIADSRSQYLGYLEFPVKISCDLIGKYLVFQYGYSGYSVARLFYVDQAFSDKYNLLDLMRQY